jgi:hypothetical protein
MNGGRDRPAGELMTVVDRVRSLNVLLRCERDQPDAPRVSPSAHVQEPVVQASVSGRLLPLPAPALCEGLSHLRLATEVGVGLQDYADSVAAVLLALAKNGSLESLVEQLVRGPDNGEIQGHK